MVIYEKGNYAGFKRHNLRWCFENFDKFINYNSCFPLRFKLNKKLMKLDSFMISRKRS